MLRRRRTLCVSILIPILLLAATVQAAPPVVHSEKAAEAPRVVELEEIWRVGGADDEHVFGVMIDARCDEAGNVYLLDHQLSRVTMVSPEGEYVRELGGEGDGPGECRMPQTLTMMPDGSIGLGQRFPGRFIHVAKDGTPAGRTDIGGSDVEQTGFVMLLSGRNRGGTFLAGSMHQVPGEGGQSRNTYLNSLAPDGRILAQLAAHETYLDFTKAHFAELDMVAPFAGAHEVGPDGLVYLGPKRNEYRIDVVRPDGTPVRTITRNFDVPKRDQQTLDRMNALFEEQDRALPFRITWSVEPCDPVVGGLVVTKDNELLVSSSRSGMALPDGVFTSYDVFDAGGRFHHELHVKCDADRDQDGFIWLDDGRVLLVRGLQLARLTASGNGGNVVDEDEEGAWAIEIICCRLKG